MNSLTLISELIHHSPITADQFIQALATEFRLLNQYVSLPKIPLWQEVELCQNYLDMMNIRQQLTHNLKIEGNINTIDIPPALLLTLLENAFSHNKYQTNIVFELNIQDQKSNVTINFRLPKGQQRMRQGIGIGVLYIKQSLQQVFSHKATFQIQEKDDAWLAIFILLKQ